VEVISTEVVDCPVVEVIGMEVVDCPLVLEVFDNRIARVAFWLHIGFIVLVNIILLVFELSTIMKVVPDNVSIALNPVESGTNVV